MRQTAGLVNGMLPLVCAILACSGQRAADDRSHGRRIEDARFVELGGIDQWITVRGEDDRNPILLLVHGGPGDVQSPLVATYQPYEREYVLVQWDQRGAGRTSGRYGNATPDLTLDRIVADGVELAEYLRDRFPDSDIIVLGHSWGTAIATRMVLARPDLFDAYVGTGQIASWAEAVHWQFDFLKQRAREEHDNATLDELRTIGRPDPANAEQYFGFTRSLRRHFNPSDSAWLANLGDLVRRSVTQEEFDLLVEGMNLSATKMLPFQMQQHLSTRALHFAVPWFVIQGSDDLATPTPPAAAYFEKVVAPRKQMHTIAGAGHFALVTHRQEFLAALRELLRSR